ncbi:MAG: M20 family metallopeptidase [bacterium]|nr:M20 family metallopeptidase [bacterium]
MSEVSVHDVEELLVRMVRIPSVNPRGEDKPAEGELGRFVGEWLAEAGLHVETHEAFPGRSNVVARLPGTSPEPALLLNSHLDTVETDGMTVEPFGAEVRDGRLYGRGSCDAKGCLSAFMLAVRAVARSDARPPRDVELVASVDEEAGGGGILRFMASLPEPRERYAAALIGEPTELRLVTATKGGIRFTVRTLGRASHSSQPWEGDNAIYRMQDVLTFLRKTLEPELSAQHHPLVGTPTIVPTLISGGAGWNIVPPSCTVSIDRRLVPGEDPMEVFEGYRERFLALAPGHIEVEGPPQVIFAPETPPDAPIARAVGSALSARGLDATPLGVNYGTDGAKIAPHGIPIVVFGPDSISRAHQADESVSLEEVATAAGVVIDVVRNFSG